MTRLSFPVGISARRRANFQPRRVVCHLSGDRRGSSAPAIRLCLVVCEKRKTKGLPNQRRFKNPRHVARYPRSFLLGKRRVAGEREGAREGWQIEGAPRERERRRRLREELEETCRTVKSIMRNLVCKSRKKDEAGSARPRDETEKGERVERRRGRG